MKNKLDLCVAKVGTPKYYRLSFGGDGVGEEVVLSIQGILTGSDFRPPFTELS